MKFKLEITLGNDAMQTGEDIAEALCKVGEAVIVGVEKSGIWDINGNRVGHWEMTD